MANSDRTATDAGAPPRNEGVTRSNSPVLIMVKTPYRLLATAAMQIRHRAEPTRRWRVRRRDGHVMCTDITRVLAGSSMTALTCFLADETQYLHGSRRPNGARRDGGARC